MLLVVALMPERDRGAFAAPTAYPASTERLLAPDGRASLKLRDPGEGIYGYHNYSLILRDADKDYLIVRFMRDIEVEWSSNSRAFFVTDWTSPDFTECMVVLRSKPRPKLLDMTKLVKEHRLPGYEWNLNNSQHYMRCLRWETANVLRFRLAAVPDDRQLRTYEYDLDISGKPTVTSAR